MVHRQELADARGCHQSEHSCTSTGRPWPNRLRRGAYVTLDSVSAQAEQRQNVFTRVRTLRPRTREALTFYLVIAPWIIGFLVFTLGPMLYSVFLSMAKWDIIGTPRWVGLKNFQTLLFKDDLFWKSLKVTAIYSFGGVPLQLSLSLLLAVLLNRASKLRNIFRQRVRTQQMALEAFIGIADARAKGVHRRAQHCFMNEHIDTARKLGQRRMKCRVAGKENRLAAAVKAERIAFINRRVNVLYRRSLDPVFVEKAALFQHAYLYK